MTTVAFIGLGNMGLPMAANLVRAGYHVLGVDLAPSALEAAADRGIDPVATLSDAVADASVVVTMLPAGAQVRQAYLERAGILESAAPSVLLIDCSTIDVETAREVEAAARTSGRAMLDAPVSGGIAGAAEATLTFMVGGTEEALERARPILEVMGRSIVHAGPPGAGQAAKICNNMILGISMIAVSEAFALADQLGLERQKLFEVASKSSGQCWSLTSYCPVPGPVPGSPANRGYNPGFTAAMMLKDLSLAQDAARKVGASTPLGAAAQALYALYARGPQASSDFSGIFRMLSGDLKT